MVFQLMLNGLIEKGKFYVVQSRPITTLGKKEGEKDKEREVILDFSKDSEIFRWGPIPGKYFYAAGDIIDSFFIKKYKGYTWPDSFYLFRDGRMVWLTEFKKV